MASMFNCHLELVVWDRNLVNLKKNYKRHIGTNVKYKRCRGKILVIYFIIINAFLLYYKVQTQWSHIMTLV